MARHLSQPSLRPLALAIPLLMGTVLAVQAPVSLAAEQQHYDLPAGPLAERLNQFASQAGIYLAGDAGLTRDRQSQALKGNHSVEQALGILLRGTGLNAIRVASGRYELSAQNALELDATNIVDVSAKDSAITEGTGSYTTGVTSTATRMNLSIRETPQSISVVTRQRMDDQDLTSITKVLEQTPGVTISRDAGERFNIYSRGNEITKYQYDGLTTHVENQTQNMTQNLTDMSIYDKIEIVRGATGLMTGAGHPSGMVNMARKRPTKEFQASLSGSVGRWDDYRGQVDVSGPLIESGKLRARFVGAKQGNDSFTDYYSQRRDIFYGVTEADITNSMTVRFGVDYQKYEIDGGQGVPLHYNDGEQANFSRSTTVSSKHSNSELETTNYFFNIDQMLENDWKLTVAGAYMDVDRNGSGGVGMLANRGRSVNKQTGDFRAGRAGSLTNPLSQKSAAINLQGPFSLFGREHQAVIGYEFNRYNSHYKNHGYSEGTANLSNLNALKNITMLIPDDELYLIQDFKITQRGYYTALRFNPIEHLYATVGARTSDYKYESVFVLPSFNYYGTTGYSKTGEVTPYAGLVYDLTPQQSIYFSYTDIFTPNNVTDINNKVIEPQVGSNYEIGWKGEFYDGKLNTNIAVYQVKRDNATELAGYHANSIAYYRAIEGMKTKGIDIELAGELLPDWNVSASYSHSRSEDGDGKRETTGHPLDTVKLWNTYNFSGDLQGLTIGGGARWLSKTDSVPITASNVYYKAVQDDYVVIDAMARYKFNRHLSATLNINNLLDKKYYTAVGDFGYGYYGAPRNLTLGVRYDF